MMRLNPDYDEYSPTVHNVVNGYGDPCPPRFGPDINVDLENHVEMYKYVARLLKKELFPWQEYICTILSEITGTKNFPVYGDVEMPRWPNVDYTLSRQNGKTFLTLDIAITEMVAFGKAKNLIYSAQSGQAARAKLEDDFVKDLKDSKIYQVMGFKHRGGVIGDLTCTKTGSKFNTFGGSETAGHGSTNHVIIMDELFAITDDAIEIALAPTQTTIPDSRRYRLSAAGDENNEYLVNIIDTGRAKALAIKYATDEQTKKKLIDSLDTAYIEWSAPMNADIENPQVWWDCLPSLGYIIYEDDVRNTFNNSSESYFRRTVLNQVLRTGNYDAIPEALWLASLKTHTDPGGNKVVLAVANDKNGKKCSAVICGSNGEAMLVEHASNIEYLKKAIPLYWNNRGKNGITHIVTKNDSYFGGKTTLEFENKKIPVTTYSDDAYKHACMSLLDTLIDGRLAVEDSSDIITDAVKIAQQTDTKMMKWKWDTTFEDLDISALEALTLAVDFSQSNISEIRTNPFVIV